MGVTGTLCATCGRTPPAEAVPIAPGTCPGCGGARFPSLFRLPPPGTLLGGLLVEGVLGRGGMGTVVQARDPRLDRVVAVKFMKEGAPLDENSLRSFRREGAALARIDHPNVVRVLHAGDWNGWPYLVIERVEGRTLQHRLDEGRVPLEAGLRLARQLASALSAVHARRVVHRDVTPNNCLLRRDDGSLCLIDFGLAQVLDRDSGSTGPPGGTVHYIAPERYLRRAHDQRADVYSFGATVFHLLSGTVPFEGLEGPPFLRALVQEDPPLLRELDSRIPRPVEELVARCLARAPEFRPRDGAALERALGVAAGKSAARAARSAGKRAPRLPPEDPSEEVPLLGRDDDYAAAASVLDEAAAGRGGTLLVEGPPGSGKSRFLREVERGAQARAMDLLRCRGSEFAGIPYQALRSALSGRWTKSGAIDPEGICRRVAESSPADEPLLPALRWFLHPGTGDPMLRPGRTELTLAVLALVRTNLAERPALLAVEDAHLLDEATLDLLLAVGREAKGWPLALAITSRGPGDPMRGAAFEDRSSAFAALPRARRLELGPLAVPAVARIAAQVLGLADTDARRLALPLHRRTGGNPLFVMEGLRLMRAERRTDPGVGTGALALQAAKLRIPAALAETCRRRIARLPVEDREALGVVALDPDGVGSSLVARALEVPRMHALRALQRLVEGHGIVREEAGRYYIPHPEVREVVHEGLVGELREAWHAEAARQLATEPNADPGRVARHLRDAGRPREAVEGFVAAGRRHLVASCVAEAREAFDQALACAGSGGCAPAAIGRAEALAAAGEVDEGRRVLEKFARGGAGDPDAVIALCRLEREGGHDGRILDILDRAATGLRGVKRRRDALLLRGQALSRLGRATEAIEALDAAEAGAKPAGPAFRAVLGITRGKTHHRAGRERQARAAWTRALRHAEAAGDQGSALVLRANLALAALELGSTKEARERAEEVAALAEALGAERERVFARLLVADAHLRALELDEAEAILDRAERAARALRNAPLLENATEMRAELALARGDGEAALRAAFLGVRGTRAFPANRARFRHLRARALRLLGKHESALRDAREARRGFEEAGDEGSAAACAALAALCLRAEGRDGPEREWLRGLAGAAPDSESAAVAAIEAA
ncbi:MAG TPA: protein kinase, partial [Planctomycetota bacterium]|nr:protein kinase [Planctomycetota bacterium]